MTPKQYAKKEIAEGRFPQITIMEIAGSVLLGDSEWNILAGGKNYPNRVAAENDRSRILDKAMK